MNSPTNASRTSSTPAAGSLRPRTRRLISGLSDDEGGSTVDITSAPSTRFASPRGSRPSSPLPTKYPSRTSVRGTWRDSDGGSKSAMARGGRVASPASFASIWGGSWAGLQGLASGLIGSESASKNSSAPARGGHVEASSGRSRTSAPIEWGPAGAGSIQVGGGTKEERDALVRAAKRKDLLRANGRTMMDTSGRHKRRTSDDLATSSSVQPCEDDDRDALVYLHHVRVQDTFIGLTIRYSCPPAILRKANRMWPSDPIQSREHILLPVDSCGVKGKPVAGPDTTTEEHDLLGEASEHLSMHESPKSPGLEFPDGWPSSSIQIPPSASQTDTIPPSSTVSTSGETLEPEWKHESWVLFPNETEPIEIVRLPRKNLGFFPRARRKSNPYSDLDTPRITPKHSLDIPRIPSNPGSAQREAYATLRPGTNNYRARSASNSLHPSRNLASSIFQGPGGVGSLGRNVRTIGPPQDRFNEILGPHLPNVAPPSTQTVFTPWNPGLRINDDLVDFAESLPATNFRDDPPTSEVSMQPGAGSMDLQEMTGKVERWVRKGLKRAGSAYSTSASAAAAKGHAGVQGMGAGSGVGDLIELTDAFEIGDGSAELDLMEVGNGPSGSSAANMIGSASTGAGSGAGEGMRGRKMARNPAASAFAGAIEGGGIGSSALGKGGKKD